MSKVETVFNCSNCGAQFSKWTGRCLECGQWGTIEKTNSKNLNLKTNDNNNYPIIETIKLSDVQNSNLQRNKTNIGELDRVLGGGLVPGSLILLGGEPGVGKSTLALQLASTSPDTLYLSGEESTEQIKLRSTRLRLTTSNLRLGAATNVEQLIATIKQLKPTLTIIDSIQTISSDDAEGTAGSISQVRACAAKLMELAKTSRTTIVLIGQVTKDGAVAGPKTLEHLVDTVLYLEGDRFHQLRILRAVKNRFGSTDEIGVFEMKEDGLREVTNPSAAFLSGRGEQVPGSVVTCLIEGGRPVLIEVQALVTKTNFGYPQRRASGFDLNRLQVLIGVLSRRAGLPLDQYDVFLNVVGGLSAEEPAADLAVIVALASAVNNKTVSEKIVSFGEVGLGGEVRAVGQTAKRLEEIKRLGFEFAVIPASVEIPKIPALKIAAVKNVKEVVEKILA